MLDFSKFNHASGNSLGGIEGNGVHVAVGEGVWVGSEIGVIVFVGD